jgi:hypothetical protein
MPKANRRAPGLGEAALELMRTLARDLFDQYRPELHYMRGPGPKWHAKHDLARHPAPQGLRQARA